LSHAILDIGLRPSGIRIDERWRRRNDEASFRGDGSWYRLTAD